MGALEIILVLGIVAAGGWCVLAGPCKSLLGGPIKAGAIVRPTPKGKPVPRCGPGEITTEAGCAEAVKSAYASSLFANSASRLLI